MKSLEARQRTLANEKAQVEDQRGGLQLATSQLATLAGEQRDCSNGLSKLLNEFAANDYDAVDADSPTVGSACQKAEDDFAAFQAQYGGTADDGRAGLVRGARGCSSPPPPRLLLGASRVSAPAALVPPKTVALSAAGKRALRVDPIQLASDSLTRTAEKLTLRVRNISCSGVAVGSAWALDPHTLITNRHVLAGASVLEADTWDGESIELNVANAQTGRLVDIGIATVPETLPQVANTGPAAKPGDKVTAVGYPLGGKLTLSPGRVVRYLDGRTLDPSIAFDGQVDAAHHQDQARQLGRPGPRHRAAASSASSTPASRERPSRTTSRPPTPSRSRPPRTLLDAGGTQAVTPCEQ